MFVKAIAKMLTTGFGEIDGAKYLVFSLESLTESSLP